MVLPGQVRADPLWPISVRLLNDTRAEQAEWDRSLRQTITEWPSQMIRKWLLAFCLERPLVSARRK